MTKIDQLTLKVTDPIQQKQFYCDVLGMMDLGRNTVGYAGAQASISFTAAETPYSPEKSELYWKIALSVPNIELACSQLQWAGVQCTDPHQFEDVGYLAHFTDPEGFPIELIDHAFKGHRLDDRYDKALFGGGAHLNLVTLRTANINEVEPQLLKWGMRKLSVQPVEKYGFTLHFYGFTDETPPDENLMAVINRTWVYQRPFTVLELQEVSALKTVSLSSKRAGGYDGLTIASDTPQLPLKDLRIDWTFAPVK